MSDRLPTTHSDNDAIPTPWGCVPVTLDRVAPPQKFDTKCNVLHQCLHAHGGHMTAQWSHDCTLSHCLISFNNRNPQRMKLTAEFGTVENVTVESVVRHQLSLSWHSRAPKMDPSKRANRMHRKVACVPHLPHVSPPNAKPQSQPFPP